MSDETAARRSGRVSRHPTRYGSVDTSSVAGRKRSLEHDSDSDSDVAMGADTPQEEEDEEGEEDGGGGDDDDDDESVSDENDSDGDRFVGPGEKRAATKTKKKAPPPQKRARPAAKRVKTAHVQTEALAALPSRPKKKTVRIDPDDIGDGLYAEVFSSGESAKTVAEQWHRRWEEQDSLATADMVNLILQCSGCQGRVTVDDINDPDHCPGRLSELQLDYQEQQLVSDYPLISRTKRNFRAQMVAFFKAIIRSAHDSERLYRYPEMLSNLMIWPQTMSSSTLRPFRHTATSALLMIADALVDVGVTLDERISKHKNGLRSRSSAAQANREEIQRSLEQATTHRKVVAETIEELFSTVVIHRYRDKEPRIRTECVESLGYWIWRLPGSYMDGEHLRYLGWLLSDTNAGVRQEVVRQLTRIIGRDFQQLGQFIDRFRPRIVDMARRDLDASVRVASINLAETLRFGGLLEAPDVDEVCKIIFDADLRVRKAVAPFVKACIDDVIETKLEEMGGEDTLTEAFEVYANATEDRDWTAPRRAWVTIKALAESLVATDAQLALEDQDAVVPRPIELATDLFRTTLPETHLSLAGQALQDVFEDLREWEMLAGYLLVDHSSSIKRGGDDAAIRAALAPQPGEEAVLLEVLYSVSKARLHVGGRMRTDAQEAQEESTVEFAALLPKLLAKYGGDATTASPILRMEHHLDLGIFQQLRQDSTSSYDHLLDEVVKQFARHDSERVVCEAVACLVHARRHEELEEAVDTRLAPVWDNLVSTLRNFEGVCELRLRGDLGPAQLKELRAALTKLRRLLGAANGTGQLESTDDVVVGEKSNDQNEKSSGPVRAAIDLLIDVVHRGKLVVEDPDLDELEDEVTAHAIGCCLFYAMWKVRALLTTVGSARGSAKGSTAPSALAPVSELSQLAARKHRLLRNLVETFSTRQSFDELRVFAAGSFCDVHVLFTNNLARLDEHPEVGRLVDEVDPALTPELANILDAAERNLSRKAHKKLNGPDDDEDPEEDLDEDDDDHVVLSKREKLRAEVKAEKALLDLAGKYVLAMLTGVLEVRDPGQGVGRLHKRMLRNAQKLGQAYRDVLAHLGGKGQKRKIGKVRAVETIEDSELSDVADQIGEESEEESGEESELSELDMEELEIADAEGIEKKNFMEVGRL